MKAKHLLVGLLFALCAIPAHAVTYRYVRITSLTAYDLGSGLYDGDYTVVAEIRLSNGGSPISPSGHSVTASDYFEGGGEPELVLDSDGGTTWHSEFDPSDVPQPHWIIYDATTPTAFDRVLWTNRSGSATGGLGDYTIEGSNDAMSWTEIANDTAQTGGPTGGATLTLLVADPSSGELLLRRRR